MSFRNFVIFSEAEVIGSYPAIYIPAIDSLVISDLHLGYEAVMAECGVFIPRVQFKKEMGMLERIVDSKRASRVIINGDVKHEFSTTTYHESREVSDLLAYLEQVFDEIILVKGNHDNYIARVTSRHGVELCDEFRDGRFAFVHGHEVPGSAGDEAETVIIGHEHPSVVLYDELGVKEKVPCFLYGDMRDGRKIIVMPPFSTLHSGSEVNVIPREELLSPILKEMVDVDELKVLGISEDVGYLEFPKLGLLRRPRRG